MVKPDKSRYAYLYLPSAEEKAKWDKLAKDAGAPLTKFVIEIVQDALSEEVEVRPRGELNNKELVDLLKHSGTMDRYGVLEALGIDLKDSEQAIRAMPKARWLERYRAGGSSRNE